MIKKIPTDRHLSRLYFELRKHGAHCIGEKYRWPYRFRSLEELIALACDMSRYDPRLTTILVNFFIEHRNKLNPAQIRSFYSAMKTVQTIAIICEFVRDAGDDELKYFCNYLQAGLAPLHLQFYFYHLSSQGGAIAERTLEASLTQYKRWGFLAREAPRLESDRHASLGKLDLASRRNILRRLLATRKQIKVSDYLEATGHIISRQQALLDLSNSSFAKLAGKGRGSHWIAKKNILQGFLGDMDTRNVRDENDRL